MADVSAKDNSQERMVNLFALICSLIMIPLISDNSMYVIYFGFVYNWNHLDFITLFSVRFGHFLQYLLHCIYLPIIWRWNPFRWMCSIQNDWQYFSTHFWKWHITTIKALANNYRWIMWIDKKMFGYSIGWTNMIEYLTVR